MKKHQTTLNRLAQELKSHGFLHEKEAEALETLKKAFSLIPDTALNDLPLPPPAELKDLPQALAIYTDGACRGNPGPGAWGCVAQTPDGAVLFEAAGHARVTTNNRMEIQGVIEGLSLLEEQLLSHPFTSFQPVIVFTDSKYVVDGLTQWVPGWKARGWKKADNKPPENLELWQELDALKSKFPQLRMNWVKGHNGHPQNEFCDRLANKLLDAEGF